MKLHALEKIVARKQKRLGQGLGSGKGKTGGRGQKGQKARGKVALGFIGGTLPLYKKLPFRKGLGNSRRSVKPIAVSLSKLVLFKKGEIVTLQSLIDKKIVAEGKAKNHGVKIMADGEIKTALNISLPVSRSAASKIEKAGGKILQ